MIHTRFVDINLILHLRYDLGETKQIDTALTFNYSNL